MISVITAPATITATFETSKLAEGVADDLHELGFKVRVQRNGSGNGAHAEWGTEDGQNGVHQLDVIGRWK